MNKNFEKITEEAEDKLKDEMHAFEKTKESMEHFFSDVWEKIKALSYDQRERTIEFYDSAAQKIEESFLKWKEKAHESGEELSDQKKEIGEKLHQKLQNFKGKISLLKESSSEAWEEISQGAKEAFQDIKTAFLDARKHFVEKDK